MNILRISQEWGQLITWDLLPLIHIWIPHILHIITYIVEITYLHTESTPKELLESPHIIGFGPVDQKLTYMEGYLPNKVCQEVWLERAYKIIESSGFMNRFDSELTELPYLEEKKHIRPWPKHMETAHNIQKTYRKHIGNNHQWKRIYSDFIIFLWYSFECKT